MIKQLSSLAFLASLTIFSTSTLAAPAASQDFGIGFVLGNPSGLSAKLPAGPANAFQFILAFDQGRGYGNRGWDAYDCGPNGPNNNDEYCDSRIYIGGDYVWYKYDAIQVSKGRLPFYYGPGVWVSASDYASFGLRFALGLEYQFATAPFDIFFELAPGVRINPNTQGYLSSGLGARFFF
jgi:hypothetical protein